MLVYFLQTVTASVPEGELRPALRVERSEVAGAGDFEPIVVEAGLIDGRAGWRVGTRVFRERLALEEALALLPREGGLFVRGSDVVEVAWAAGALQAARDAGFERVTYVPGE